jgi:hypothetical protein
MPKVKISEYSQTAANNTDINSINLAEGMLPSDVNNAIRELMKQLKDFQVGAGSDPLTVGNNLVVTGTSNLVGTATLGIVTGATINGSANTLTVDGTNPVGFRDVPPVGTKTTSYTLATGDVGKYVQVGTSGSITIPDATFAEGDIISIFNNTTGNITITCTITTAYIAGTDSDKATMTLATRGVATILFISGTVCVVSGNVS